MAKNDIQIIFENIAVIHFEELLLKYFNLDSSPDYPVCIYFDFEPVLAEDPRLFIPTYRNFRIVEADINQVNPPRELAEIITSSFPQCVSVIIRGNQFEIDEDCIVEDWLKVENLVIKILARAKLLNFKIKDIQPVSLLSENQDSNTQPWEKIPDHLWDREAVRMLLKGCTNKEIADKLGISDATVANRFSELRRDNKGLVPKRSDLKKSSKN